MNLRDDLQLIYDWIPAGSRVLDLGCGDGELLHALVKHKNCKGYGVEIDTDSVIAAIARGVNVIQADLEQGLQAFGDGSFDVIVLSQTIQAMQNVETILRERMPYDWYDTPNIHWCTLSDFDRLCAKNCIRVLERAVMAGGRRVSCLPNLMGSLAFYRVG